MTSPDTLVLPTKDGYDRWSELYDHDGNPLVALEEPLVAALLGDVRGLDVLDVGCGTGRHSLPLARQGARVTGIDFSPGMLQKAREKDGAEAVTFVEHDISTTFPFPSATFDRVISCLVVDHLSDLPRFCSELRRVCRPNGSIIISVMHPAMLLKGVQARFHDPQSGLEVRPASVANQVSDYVMGAVAAGLRIVHISEHIVDASLIARAPRAERYLDWPLLVLMKLAV